MVMKINKRQLKTLIRKNIFESISGLSPSSTIVTGLSMGSQPASTIAARWSELTGADPIQLTKLIENHIKNEKAHHAVNGIAIAIGFGVIPEDEIVSVAYNSQNGWTQDGINWYLLEEFPTSQIWQEITYLSLGEKQLASLPDSIGILTNLTTLEAWGNELTSLPNSIGNLTNLVRLELSYNKITSIPDSIGNLTNLTELDLRDNYLTELPNIIQSLTNLKRIDFSDNVISSLPDWIGNLTDLKYLSLSKNRLTSLPDSIGNLTNLAVLNLNFNPIDYMPDDIKKLTNTMIII